MNIHDPQWASICFYRSIPSYFGLHYSSLSSITCGKQSVAFTKKKEAQSLPQPVCMVVNENGRALPIIPLSSPTTTTRRSAHPGRRARRWRAFVLIWSEKPPQRTFLLLQKKNKVIYLGTSLRCHIYPSKRQRSRQVTADMSETCTGGERGGGVSEAIEQQHENLNVWGVFLKLKVILRQPLSVFHCLSRTPPRSIRFGKAPSVVKMFDRAFI